jgi:hypothetical protein
VFWDFANFNSLNTNGIVPKGEERKVCQLLQNSPVWKNKLFCNLIQSYWVSAVYYVPTLPFTMLGTIQKTLKVFFFPKVRFVFQIFQNNYSKKLSWAGNLNKLFTIIGGNFKMQAQDSFWDCEIWKTNLSFWKKAPLVLAEEFFIEVQLFWKGHKTLKKSSACLDATE